MVTEAVMGIKKGLATLYEQGMGTEVVLNVASQFAVLEQLQGWTTGTGELNPDQASTQAAAGGEAPTPSPTPETAAAPEHTPAPEPAAPPDPVPASEPAAAPEPAAPDSIPAPKVTPDPIPTPEQAAAPGPMEGVHAEAPPESSEPVGTTTIPPFTLPRERTPTGELEGPRLNTSELQDALRASAPASESPATAEPPTEASSPQAPAPDVHPESPVAAIPAAEAQPDPMDETLVSSSSKETETPAEVQGPSENAVAASDSPSEAAVPEFHVDEPFAEPELPGELQPAAEADPAPPTGSDPIAEDQPAVKVPDIAAEDQESDFPRAESGTGDVPSWVNGIEGNTDPDLLADFEFEPEQQEPAFPAAQNGEVLDDDSMFKARVIPEEMNAKLKTPTELPNTNGNQEHGAPQHEGPITIQASQADTEMFRNVLAGLSGTQVLSGDHEQAPGEPPKKNGDSVAKSDSGLDKLKAAASDAPTPEHPAPKEPIEAPTAEVQPASPIEAPTAEIQPASPIEAPPAEVQSPSAEEFRQVRDPEPQPVHAEPANWPPTLPTEDDDWDDELDVSA
jgi:hypothetical protein